LGYAAVDGHGVGAVLGVKFLHQTVDVEAECLMADVKPECNRLICVAFCYVSEYLEFSLLAESS
jgi:hypothetical protein